MMSRNVYLVMVGSNPISPDIVYSRDSELKLAVYFTDDMPYVARKDEIQLYGYLNEKLIVFETIDISPDDALEVITAIKWYTQYIGHPEIEILPDDPRVEQEINIAL
ncbi:hypothetical protein KXQ82_03430 [Mucilaginibacter sp. HMF5004]|uniref:hypothetical protein n=1 Tax=Mucilaginibacter rivuli TaxID=2857527 RepID=UPI001C5D9F39|nr:hypothetical protein [Mucilaginibacter rivuli]MBW4888745.1 hypothetical protein [Mucilaginibacter rivuli]